MPRRCRYILQLLPAAENHEFLKDPGLRNDDLTSDANDDGHGDGCAIHDGDNHVLDAPRLYNKAVLSAGSATVYDERDGPDANNPSCNKGSIPGAHNDKRKGPLQRARDTHGGSADNKRDDAQCERVPTPKVPHARRERHKMPLEPQKSRLAQSARQPAQSLNALQDTPEP